MTKKINMMIVLIILTLTLSGCIETKEGLLAKVDGEEITEDQLNNEYEVLKNIYTKQFGEDAMTQKGEDGRSREEILKEQILEKIIMEMVIEKESEDIDIAVSDEEIEGKVEEYIVMTGGEEKFNEFLDSNDLTRDYFIENLRKEILVSKHKEYFISKTEVSDEEAKDFFEKNKENLEVIRASHILLKTEDQANQVLDKINTGEVFEELAKELSLDKASALLGGDLGYFTKGSRIAGFEDVAFGLEEDELSDVVETEVGYHIIKLTDRKDTIEELEDEIKMVLKEEKYKEEKNRLKEKSKIKIY